MGCRILGVKPHLEDEVEVETESRSGVSTPGARGIFSCFSASSRRHRCLLIGLRVLGHCRSFPARCRARRASRGASSIVPCPWTISAQCDKFSAQCHKKDAIVRRRGPTASITVAREHEELATGQLEHVTQAAVLVLKQPLFEGHAAPVRAEHDAMQMRSTQCREEK